MPSQGSALSLSPSAAPISALSSLQSPQQTTLTGSHAQKTCLLPVRRLPLLSFPPPHPTSSGPAGCFPEALVTNSVGSASAETTPTTARQPALTALPLHTRPAPRAAQDSSSPHSHSPPCLRSSHSAPAFPTGKMRCTGKDLDQGHESIKTRRGFTARMQLLHILSRPASAEATDCGLSAQMRGAGLPSQATTEEEEMGLAGRRDGGALNPPALDLQVPWSRGDRSRATHRPHSQPPGPTATRRLTAPLKPLECSLLAQPFGVQAVWGDCSPRKLRVSSQTGCKAQMWVCASPKSHQLQLGEAGELGGETAREALHLHRARSPGPSSPTHTWVHPPHTGPVCGRSLTMAAATAPSHRDPLLAMDTMTPVHASTRLSTEMQLTFCDYFQVHTYANIVI